MTTKIYIGILITIIVSMIVLSYITDKIRYFMNDKFFYVELYQVRLTFFIIILIITYFAL